MRPRNEVDFTKTEAAIKIRDQRADENATMIEMQKLNRACAVAFADDTAEYNDRDTVLGLFHAAPPPFVRACVARWRHPEKVMRIEKLKQKLDDYSGLTHRWYELGKSWAYNTGALTLEEYRELDGLFREIRIQW